MPPPAAVPKSFWGPPARDPPPSWVIPASRRTPQHASIHFRGFSGEFDFSIPNEEMAATTHRIIQGEQALQLHHCQIQSWQYQMGLLQTPAQIQQLQLLSQSSQVSQTQKLVLPDWALPEPQNRVGNRVQISSTTVLGVRNVTDRSLTDVLLRAQKYANYGTDRPLCLIGLTVGCETHGRINRRK